MLNNVSYDPLPMPAAKAFWSLAWGFPGHGAVGIVFVSPWSSGIYNSLRTAPVPGVSGTQREVRRAS